jgi:hypothetical protein
MSGLMKAMMDYWNQSKFPVTKKYRSNSDKAKGKYSKTYMRTARLLSLFIKGTIYNGKQAGVLIPKDFEPQVLDKQRLDDFRYHVDCLEKKAFDLHYQPINPKAKEAMQKITLERFLGGNPAVHKPAALLLYTLEEPVAAQRVKPLNKKLTAKLIASYEDMVKRPVKVEDTDMFTKAANRIHRFFHANRDTFMFYGCMDALAFLDSYYIPALLESWGPQHVRKMGPKYLACEKPIAKDVVDLLLDRRTIRDLDELDMTQ